MKVGTPVNESKLSNGRRDLKNVVTCLIIFASVVSSDPKTNAFYDNANTRIVPTEGNYWYDIANNIIYIYSNDKWEPAIIWSTRTFTEIENYANINAQSFKRISPTGILSIPSGYNGDSVRGICIEFAIGG